MIPKSKIAFHYPSFMTQNNPADNEPSDMQSYPAKILAVLPTRT